MADYTIASQVKPPQIDPIAIVGNVQALQKGQLSNKLLGMNVAQTQAQRTAAQGAVGPDGGFDVDKYESALAGGGASPEAIASAQQIRQVQLQNQVAKLGLTKAQMDVSQQELGNGAQVGQGILANGTKDPAALTKEGIAAAIQTNLIQPGLVRTPEGLQHAQQFIASLTDDPATNAKLVQQWVNQSEDITKAMGAISNVDTGGNIVQQRVNPATGEPSITGQINKGRTPSEKANLVPTYDPTTGKTTLKTSGEIIGDAGPAAEHPQSGPALGDAEAASRNVQQAQGLQQRASIVPQRRAALSNLSDSLKDFTPGPKADLTYGLKALATQFGLAAPSSAKGVAAQEEFNKLSSQIALDQWGALGGTGTNDQLASTVKANPHEAMSKMGIKNVVALLQGNEDAIGAQFEAWQKFKAVHGAASYDQFQQGWNRYYDPRVFQAEHMAPADVKAMIAGMTSAERKTFTRDQNIAQQAGWLGK